MAFFFFLNVPLLLSVSSSSRRLLRRSGDVFMVSEKNVGIGGSERRDRQWSPVSEGYQR